MLTHLQKNESKRTERKRKQSSNQDKKMIISGTVIFICISKHIEYRKMYITWGREKRIVFENGKSKRTKKEKKN